MSLNTEQLNTAVAAHAKVPGKIYNGGRIVKLAEHGPWVWVSFRTGAPFSLPLGTWLNLRDA